MPKINCIDLFTWKSTYLWVESEVWGEDAKLTQITHNSTQTVFVHASLFKIKSEHRLLFQLHKIVSLHFCPVMKTCYSVSLLCMNKTSFSYQILCQYCVSVTCLFTQTHLQTKCGIRWKSTLFVWVCLRVQVEWSSQFFQSGCWNILHNHGTKQNLTLFI